jgi:GT2 family glycosyltransferase
MNNNYLIILLNYNNWQDTIECIQSLKKCDIKGSNVLVVENNSFDDSIGKLKSETPDVRMIIAERNLGFAGGNNIGIKYACENNFDYAIVLNNDTIVESENSFKVLIDEMDKNPGVSLSTGRIFHYPEKNRIWYDGGEINSLRCVGIHLNLHKKVDEVNLDGRNKFVTFISGCFMCIRLKDISKLGYLDEKLFIYFEDFEYCLRAIRNNLKLLYIPESVIYHKTRGEGRHSPRLIYYTIRNRKFIIDSYFGISTKFYFMTVMIIKRFYWFFTNKKYYKILKYALNDYKKSTFGKAPDYIK